MEPTRTPSRRSTLRRTQFARLVKAGIPAAFLLLPIIALGLLSLSWAGENAKPPRGNADAVRVTEQADTVIKEIQQVMRAEQLGLRDLQARFEAAASHAEALTIQRETEQLKRSTELSLLRIQLDYARQTGNTETAAELESLISEYEAGPQPTPHGRPTANDGNARHDRRP